MEINAQREDYITTIFKLCNEENKKVSNKKISDALGISPSSVTEMLKKFKTEGLIKDTKNIELTEVGENIAKSVLSKHRLWEKFFMEVLHYNWANLHENANLFQSVTNKELLERLNEFLGFPEYCPHGSIIYINNEENTNQLVKLSEAKLGIHYVIRRIKDDRKLLNYLDKLNIEISKKIIVNEFDDFDGTVMAIVEGHDVRISPKASEYIYLKEIH